MLDSITFRSCVVAATISLASSVAILACDDSSSDGVSEDAVLDHIADQVILPAHQAFVDATESLALTAANYCDGGLDADLPAVHHAWLTAQTAEQHVELYNFGPWTEFPELLGSRINSWPAAPNNIEALLGSETPLTIEELQRKGSRERGLPVVEYLLFEDRGDDALNDGFVETRRCDYLVAATADLREQAKALHDAWSPDGGNYVTKLIRPDGSDMMFETTHDALSELVNRMWFAIENLRRDTISKSLTSSPANANPLAAEGARGDAVYDTMIATLDAVEELFLGAPACSGDDSLATPKNIPDVGCEPLPNDGSNPSTPSIDRLLAERGRPDVVLAFEQEVRGARASVRSLPADWSNAVYDGRASVATMSDELKDVQLILQADVFNVLGLSIAFNDNDGD